MVPSSKKDKIRVSKTAGRAEQFTPSKANQKHSLYLRFPKKLKADRTLAVSEVKLLHSKIIQVRIPRQKSANFCLVDFESKFDMEKAAKELKKVQINEKNLIVKDAIGRDPSKVKKKQDKVDVKRDVDLALRQLVGEIKKSLAKDYRKRPVTNGIILKGLRKGSSEADVKQSFPNAIDVKIITKPIEKNSLALIWLPTPKDAKKATKEMVEINDIKYSVRLQKDLQNYDESESKEGNSNEDDNVSETNSMSEESDSEENLSEDGPTSD